jgi:hypothetical protein
MLTHQDRTVPNAYEIFQEMKETPVQHWGFKDVGLPPDQVKTLVRSMRDAGKTTYLEVVSLSEEEGMAGARLAVEAGFHYLLGTVCYDTILRYLEKRNIQYCPFPGHVYGHPSIVDGEIDDIVNHARELEAKGATGLDLLAYRYIGDADSLLVKVVDAVHVPVIAAGSIASYERMARVWKARTWGFTIGGAFFENKFVPDGGFQANVMQVWNWLENTAEATLDDYIMVKG